MLTSIDVIITYRREEYKIHDNKRCSLAHIRPQIPVIICATFTVLATFLENSLTIFFAKQKNCTTPFCYPSPEQLSVRVAHL